MQDVVIVGLGPVGAVLGNLLGAIGLDVAIFERDADIVPIPRAIAFDGEIMRLYQTLGLVDALAPLIRPSDGAQYLDPAGEVMLRRLAAHEEGPQGWPPFYNFHQPKLERALRDGLARYPSVSAHLRHDVYAVDEQDDHVVVRVEDMATGMLRHVAARFVIGCDGARSLVRRLIGGRMTDLGLHEPWVVADFVLTGDAPRLPAITTQFCDATTPVTFVRGTDNRRRFEFKQRPGTDLRAAAVAENVWTMVAPWLSPHEAELERAAPYTFHSLIAEQWRRGRLVIAGDSAHQTPPFMGQGLCAGLRDAANLAWKIERILRHDAPLDSLDSYPTERIAHVEEFIAKAVRLGAVFSAETTEQMRALAAAEATPGSDSVERPAPTLGRGLHDGSPGAGRIASQPRLADGRLLDDAIGYRFALIATPDILAGLDCDMLDRLADLSIEPVLATGPAQAWLAEVGRPLVLLRPDRYVLASFSDAAALDRFLPGLVEEIGAATPTAARSGFRAMVADAHG